MSTHARSVGGLLSQRSSTIDDPLLGPLDPSISAYASTSSASTSLHDDNTADAEDLGTGSATIRSMGKGKSSAAPTTTTTSSNNGSSYSDLTRRTAEVVERTQAARRGFSPYSNHHHHHLLSPQLGAPPPTAAQTAAAVAMSSRNNGSGSARSLSLSRAAPVAGDDDLSRSHSHSRAASILFGDDDEDGEEADETGQGLSEPLLSDSIKLLSALHEMNDAELERHIVRTPGGALSLLRSVSRTLADWREESASQQNELIK